MVFSKSNIALLVLTLGATNISTSFAVLPENDRVIAAAPRFTTKRIIDFIHGKDHFSTEATRQSLMRTAYDHLTNEITRAEENFEENWPKIVKNILGLAELLQNHPTRSLPGRSSYESARYVMELLSEIIRSPEGVEDKHIHYAKIYWGQLLVKRIGIQMAEEDKAYAWKQLSSIDNNYTKIGNVYRASLLLEHDYIPEDVIYSEQGVAQIGRYAQDLLTSSYYKTRTKRIRALRDLARDRRVRENQSAEVEVREMSTLEAIAALNVKPQNLTEQDAIELRAKLIRKAANRVMDDRQLEEELHSNDDNLMDIERSENRDFHPASGSKRSRDEFESESFEDDSDDEESKSPEKSSREESEFSERSEPLPTSGQNGSQDEEEDESNSSGLSSENEEDDLQDLSSSNAESGRSPIILSSSQLQRFFELYSQYSGPVLHEKLRSEVLTPEQSASFESNKQFKNWMSNTRITAQRKGLVLPSKTAKSIPFTEAQFTQIANQFQGGKVSIDDTFRRTVWTLLTEAQKSCFPEGYNSAKFKSYTAHQKVKFIASGITFRK